MGTWYLQPLRQVTQNRDWTERGWWPPSRAHQDALWLAEGSEGLQGPYPRAKSPERGGMWGFQGPWEWREEPGTQHGDGVGALWAEITHSS